MSKKLIQVLAKSRPDRVNSELYCNSAIPTDVRDRFILKTIKTASHSMSIVDKTSPHALLDIMVTINASQKTALSFNELSSLTRNKLLSLLHKFYCYVIDSDTISRYQLTDSVLRISANVAKLTEDRIFNPGGKNLSCSFDMLSPTLFFRQENKY